mmetsp:Transcript_23439/g.39289  ORF Transcript_23439/g.39289 Transcript_23439/m.39289 type:complete len:232 (-) Transcript_23439:200-895(-)
MQSFMHWHIILQHIIIGIIEGIIIQHFSIHIIIESQQVMQSAVILPQHMDIQQQQHIIIIIQQHPIIIPMSIIFGIMGIMDIIMGIMVVFMEGIMPPMPIPIPPIIIGIIDPIIPGMLLVGIIMPVIEQSMHILQQQAHISMHIFIIGVMSHLAIMQQSMQHFMQAAQHSIMHFIMPISILLAFIIVHISLHDIIIGMHMGLSLHIVSIAVIIESQHAIISIMEAIVSDLG